VESGPQSETIPPGSTTVIVTLHAAEGGTEVVLRHEGLPTEKERRDHEGGWTYYLAQLDSRATEDVRTDGLERRDGPESAT
jgi:hypothetical protein